MNLIYMDNFIYMCKMYGGNRRLVQSGGGNISFKEKGKITIKSSGTVLADVDSEHGHVTLNINKCIEFYKSGIEQIPNSNPSIELFFHLFTKKYTIHLHPTDINKYMCSNKKLPFIEFPYISVEYKKPGLELAREIEKIYNGEPIIFLRQHGVIFTCDDINQLQDIVNATCDKFIFEGLTISEYCDVYRTLYQRDKCLNILDYVGKYIKINPLTPDIVVYLKDSNFFLQNDNMFIWAKSKYSCYLIGEVLDSYMQLKKSEKYLSEDDVKELLGWSKEKYRQNILSKK